MIRNVLIASGAYLEPELEAEFGVLPPAFLPLGNQRLFAHQAMLLRGVADRMLLSVPEDFYPGREDIAVMDRFGIEMLRIPNGLTLGHSVVYAVNLSCTAGQHFAILHGDTIVRGIDFGMLDQVSVTFCRPSAYRWGDILVRDGRLHTATPSRDAAPLPEPGTEKAVLTGFFSFADAAVLVQTITRAGGDFVAGVRDYGSKRQVKAIEAKEWLDFGHTATYFRSRRHVSTTRQFNELHAERRSVLKSGSKHRKIEGEARWYRKLPSALRLHTPAFLGISCAGGKPIYEIEYLNLPTLADLHVFGRLNAHVWDRIFAACDEFLTACARHPASDEAQSLARGDLYLNKTLDRLGEFARATGVSFTAPCRLDGHWLPSLEKLATIAAQEVSGGAQPRVSVVHGDFCFSNILYDMRADMVKVIDPRGLDAADSFSIYGDIRYDIGKLFHSAVGQYDHIIAGNFRLDRQGPLDFSLELPSQVDFENAFLACSFAGFTPEKARAHAIGVLLFLSMLPLHADNVDRQSALLANALRLFRLLDSRQQS